MSLQGRDVTPDDMKDAILQLTVTEHYYTGVQDLVTLLCEFNDITVKACQRMHSIHVSFTDASLHAISVVQHATCFPADAFL